MKADTPYPDWLEGDLRSDHAGETGAVWIYRGALRASRDDDLRRFASRHPETERKHLALLERLLPPGRRSRLLPLWRAAGFALGALPALIGPAAVYATVDAVESFVDGHYGRQIERLAPHREWLALRRELQACRDEELAHRDEARAQRHARPGFILRLWGRAIAAGSAAAVWMARRF